MNILGNKYLIINSIFYFFLSLKKGEWIYLVYLKLVSTIEIFSFYLKELSIKLVFIITRERIRTD